jgi:hypothetical protein
MTITPEFDFEYDYERSRAAVAIACLRWLGCTGPDRPRAHPLEVEGPDSFAKVDRVEDLGDFPHPLWDRWIDD